MEIFAIEIPHVFGRVSEQLTRVKDALRALPPRGDAARRLVLLPETCLTGYVSPAGDFDLTRFAEPLDGPTARALGNLARENSVVLVAPLVERDRDRAYNTTLVLGEDGATLARYRKRHPWFPETWASPGLEPIPMIDLGDVSVTICVCFDIHFVAAESARELDVADVLLFPSAWVDGREPSDPPGETRTDLLAQLSRNHNLVTVNANWGHGIPAIQGQGGSQIIDPHGQPTSGDGSQKFVIFVMGTDHKNS